MEIDFIRDHAMYAVIFGLFGFVWFGWAQASPPQSWRVPVAIASGLCFLTACIGGYLALTHWGDASALNANGAYEKFGIIVGIEFAAALMGVGVLFWLHKQEFIAPWIAFIVGLHFLSLVSIFQDKTLYLLGFLVIIVSGLAIILSKKVGISVSTLTGIGVGGSLLAFSVRGLILTIG